MAGSEQRILSHGVVPRSLGRSRGAPPPRVEKLLTGEPGWEVRRAHFISWHCWPLGAPGLPKITAESQRAGSSWAWAGPLLPWPGFLEPCPSLGEGTVF